MQIVIEKKDINSQHSALNDLADHILKLLEKGAVTVEVKGVSEGRARTLKQNACIHKYCDMLSEAYNDAGLDKQVVLEQQLPVPWTMESVKNDQWKMIQIAHGLPESTTKLETKDVSKIYDVLNRHTSTSFGISLDFPSLDSMRISQILKG